jgi:hypothetical protein
VLFAGSACVVLALALAHPVASPRETRSYPRGPFIRSFLVAMAVWSFATGLAGAAVLAAQAAWLFWRQPQESSNITERELLPGENGP